MSAEIETGLRHRLGRGVGLSFSRLPYWLIILLIGFLFTLYSILSSESYTRALRFIVEGIALTLQVSLVAYVIALVVGLLIGLGRVSKNPVLYTLATLYVEVMRGVPLLVIIFYSQFVIGPQIDTLLGLDNTLVRSTFTMGVIALALGYAAYLAEVYRAGIESIERGQGEAARSLGMTHFQAMRYIILPQAVRRVLPPLGNDFIAMLKDSSLLSVISLKELTYWGKALVGTTANTFLSWNTVAFLYLILSLILSLGVKWLEGRSGNDRR